jgi:hypothetical protein
MRRWVYGFPWRMIVTAALLIGALIAAGQHVTQADLIPKGWMAQNMHPIGYSNLDGREGAFKMAIKHVNGHWYLYTGHLWNRGWSIVDVTDPANPKVVKFIPGPPNTWTIQMELHDNTMVTALQDFSPAWGSDPKKPYDEGVLIWDISDPTNPKLLSHWKTGSTGTHRDGYPGGKYVNLAANMPGFRGQILVFLDISDSRNPKLAGEWWMPGQKDTDPKPAEPISFHGPAYIDGNTAYVGYSNSIVILNIGDIAHPKVIGELRTHPPFGHASGTAVHDVKLIPGKDLLFAHSEASGSGGDSPSTKTCDEPLPLVALINIKDPTKPYLESVFPTPVPPKGLPYADFCDKGGRFGPHNTNLEYHLPDVEAQSNLIYLTYFNAGLRVFDTADPHLPKEAGWFIPPTPPKRVGPIPSGTLVNQTEDVLVDTRGNIYITDKQWGLWILRYTGPGEPIGQSSEAQWRRNGGGSSGK